MTAAGQHEEDAHKIERGIEAVLERGDTAALFRSYFDDSGEFAGITFDTLQPNHPFTIGTADLLAVTLLDVRVRPKAVRAWLQTHEAAETSGLLKDIDPDTELIDDDADDQLARAAELWHRLQDQGGVGWVTAGKLLARKRPKLIPVYDSVVKDAMGRPERWWQPLRATLRARPDLIERIEALRPPAVHVSMLRLLDVAIWMVYSQSRNAKKARGEAGAIDDRGDFGEGAEAPPEVP